MGQINKRYIRTVMDEKVEKRMKWEYSMK